MKCSQPERGPLFCCNGWQLGTQSGTRACRLQKWSPDALVGRFPHSNTRGSKSAGPAECSHSQAEGAPRGFTLIEVVIAIIFSAFAMAAILPFLGEVFYRSSEPRTQMHDALALQAAMEGLVADYVTLATNETLVDFRQRAGSVVAAVAPSVTVISNNFTRFLLPSGQEAAPTNNTLLKITLRNSQGETATRLFGRPFQQ